MSNLIINQEYIKPLLDNNKIKVLPVEKCSEFDDYISTNFKWLTHFPDRIDWEENNINVINLSETSIEEIKDYFTNSSLGKYKYLGVIFSSIQPGVYGEINIIIDNLFSFIAHCPGPFFIVAIEVNKYDIILLQMDKFIEGNRFRRTLTRLSS